MHRYKRNESEFKYCKVSLGSYSKRGIIEIGNAFNEFWRKDREGKDFKDAKYANWEGCVTWSGDTPKAIHDLEKEKRFEQKLRFKEDAYGRKREFANPQFDLFDIFQIVKVEDPFALMRCRSGAGFYPSDWSVEKRNDEYYFKGVLTPEYVGDMVEKLTARKNNRLFEKDERGNNAWIEPEKGIIQCGDDKTETFVYHNGRREDVEMFDLVRDYFV